MKNNYIIYALYKDRNIIYIGITNQQRSRERSHRLTKQFDFMKPIITNLTKSEAEFGEKILIKFSSSLLLIPLVNKCWNKEIIKTLITEKESEGVYA